MVTWVFRLESKALPAAATHQWLLRLAGTLCFLGLFLMLDLSGALPLEEVWASLRGADLALTGFSIALYVPFLVVKTARWRAISSDMLMPLRWPDSWRIYAIGLAAGTFTPGQAGDTVKTLYLKRAGYPPGRALGGSLLDRLFDVAGLALLGLVGATLFGGEFAGQTPVLLGWIVACVAALVLVTWGPGRNWAIAFTKRRFEQLRSRAAGAKGRVTEASVESVEWSLRRGTIVLAGTLTVMSFALSIFRVWLLAGAVGVWLEPLQVVGFVGLTTAAALVPVSVGGVGTRDAVAVLTLGQLGYAPVAGLAVSTLILLLNIAQAIAGWLVWLRFGRTQTRPNERETGNV